MKRILIETTVVAAVAVGLAFALPSLTNLTYGGTSPTPAAQSNEKSGVSQKVGNGQNPQGQVAGKRKQITSEAMAAIEETRSALKCLDENKKDEALHALELATGKLDLILARDPNLALAPTRVSEATYDVYADIDKVKAARRDAEALLVAGKVPEARQILDALRSETVISVSNIPLATYPDAIKKAVKFIDDEKMEDAKDTLQTALDTLVVTDTIIPIPVVTAQDILKDAKHLSENDSRSADDNKKLSELLAEARSKLEFAQALGYGTKNDFKDLYSELDVIKEKTDFGKSGKGFFDDVEASLAKLFETLQPVNHSSSNKG